jgi:hypothetical protein
MLSVGQNQNINTKLTVPKDYTQSGVKQGQLIFWAQIGD